MSSGAVIGVVGLCVASTWAIGQMSFLSQEREILTVLTVPGEDSPPFGVSSGALGSFAEAVGDSASNGTDSASAAASQFSEIGAMELSMVGSVEGFGSLDALGVGTSRLGASFTVAESTGFAFDASFAALSFGNPLSLSIVLEDSVGQRLIDVSAIDLGGGESDVTLDRMTGTLAAGDYSFLFFIRAEGFEDAQTRAGYSVVLHVPGPGVLGAFVLMPVLVRRRRL